MANGQFILAAHPSSNGAETLEAPATRTFGVVLGNRDRVESALSAINKRAARKSLPLLAWTWGAVTVEKIPVTNDFGFPTGQFRTVTRIALTIPVSVPKYDGWRFVAALTHLDGENVIRSIPGGGDLPARFRTAGPACEHCKVSRRRADTYVLAHDDGRTVQVGSTCIGDFLGVDDAGKIASLASYVADLFAAAEGGESEEGSGSGYVAPIWALAEFLPLVAAFVRVDGFLSRTVARERGGCATADFVTSYLTNRKARKEHQERGVLVTKADETAGLAALSWAESLSDSEVSSDYLHNLRAIARTGIASGKLVGLAASIIIAHQNAIGRARKQAERAARPQLDAHVGIVGKRETFKGVTLDFVTSYETQYGVTTILKFLTAEGATLVWKASSTSIERSDVGRVYDLTGSVKGHDDYKGAKQTTLTRCKLVECAGVKVAS